MKKFIKTPVMKYVVGIVMVATGCATAMTSLVMTYLMLKRD